MGKNEVRSFSMPKIVGKERAAALIVAPPEARYLCYQWQRLRDHWLIVTVDGNQVEIYGGQSLLVHVPRPGFTFSLDGECREVVTEEGLLVQ